MFTSPPMLSLKMALSSFIVRAASMARDVWNKINDDWEDETRLWEDIF